MPNPDGPHAAVRPRTAVLTAGFDPSLSFGSARPAVFRSSTYVFPSPEEAEHAFSHPGRQSPGGAKASAPTSSIRASRIPTPRSWKTRLSRWRPAPPMPRACSIRGWRPS